jgi:hypothetical protein
VVCAEDTKPFVLEEGGIAAVVSAMQAHKEHIGIQLSSHEALTLLMDEGKKESKLTSSSSSGSSRLGGKSSKISSSKKNVPITKKVGLQPQQAGELCSA